MTICRMLTPGLLAALMHAESWVDHKDSTNEKAAQSDQAIREKQNNTDIDDSISRTERALHRSLYLS